MCNCSKSYFQGVNSTAQAAAVNGTLAFNSVSSSAGNLAGSVSLTNPGKYLVIASVSGSNTSGAGLMSIQLQNNGTAVAGATASSYSVADTGYISMGFSYIIEVLPSCRAVNNSALLSVANTGIACSYSNYVLDIIRIG